MQSTTRSITLKTGEQFAVPETAFPVEIEECGSCGHYHVKPLQGGIFPNMQDDCRFDGNRYTSEELDAVFGEEGEGWIPVSVEDQMQADDIGDDCTEV